MSKTYGKLELIEAQWRLSGITPHVAIRLKQIFPRIAKWDTGPFNFPTDSAHSADLSWFTQRYPMQMDEVSQRALIQGREQFEAEQARMEEILRRDYMPPPRVGFKPGQMVRPYQAQAAELTLFRKSLLLGDAVGLGKTYSAAALMLDGRALPAAVVMQTHLQDQMEKHD
ncbi:hypothetical protein [Paenibacillus gorillae]|uniref:hypothetical protein n=1 Tax=Paenibacillus gorillae TaxID=1243662 RepID=UPI0006947AB6|nr:hypothetical protein [Paenibacillus gorillae]